MAFAVTLLLSEYATEFKRLLRLMTYNVHSCRGGDGRLKPERILRVIRHAKPHVVALQELDGAADSQRFADELRMHHFYVEARAKGTTGFGNALLSRYPGSVLRYGALPRLHMETEARAAQWVRLVVPFGKLDIVHTHLGLTDAERLLQVERLLSSHWLAEPEAQRYSVLCGDLNARPGTPAYVRLRYRLHDAQLRKGRGAATFPALFPVVRIDHVFLSDNLAARHVEVPAHISARLASDHRPLVVDLLPSEA
ncbi:MAG TPA: endonuclease/exonuclease/phosphatase family protein, partial [Polyangiaceae bacterium]